jgi:uncharacterized protein (TIGR02099 family)
MRLLTRVLTVLVLVAGLVALLTRLATPLLSELRDGVATLASDTLGIPLTIGGIQARWHGMRPIIELRDVDIGDAPETVHAARVSLNLSLHKLFSRDLLRDSSIVIDGMRLTVVREPTGQVHLEGIDLLEGEDGDGPPAGGFALPAKLRLVNTRLVWIDRKAGRAPVELDDISAALDQEPGRFRVHASLESAAGAAELSLDIDRPPFATDWNGETYLRVGNLDVASLFAPYLPPRYGLESMEINLEAWSTWQNAAPVQSTGSLQVSGLRMRPDPPGSAFDLESMSASFDAVRERDELRIGIRDFNVAFADHAWPGSNASVRIRTPADGRREISLSSDYLRISDLAHLAAVRLPDPSWHRMLREQQPDGEVRQLRFDLQGSDDETTWQVAAQLAGIKLKPSGDIPGVHNLDAALLGDQDRLSLRIDSRNTTLLFNELFRDPLELTRLQGRMDVDIDAGHWQVRSDLLVADTPHIRTRNRLFLQQQPGQDLFIDLQTDFRDGDAAHAGLYYPAGIMGEELVHWLDSAITSGRVTGGSALIYGPADDFPFEDNQGGMFQVVFDTEDVLLEYQPGWPPLREVDAHVRFQGNHVDIHARSAMVYESRAKQLHARIGSLHPIAPLEVSGQMVGPLRNNLRVLQEEALKDRFGTLAAALGGSGDTVLDLDFRIPLAARDETYALDGRLRLDGNELSLPEWNLALSEVSGELDFTLDGISAQGIRARAIGAPVTVDVMPGPSGTTRVRTRGRLDPADIARQLDFLPGDAASGSADFTVEVDIPGPSQADATTMLRVRSTLQGIGVALPAPLGKTPSEARPLAVEVPLGSGPAQGRLVYGDALRASFSADGQRIALTFGGAEPQLGSRPGITIDGRIEHLDIDAWEAAIAQQTLTSGSDGLPPVDIGVDIGRVTALPLQIDDVALVATHAQRAWRGRIDAPTVRGSFVVPDYASRQPVRVDLDHLYLALPAEQDSERRARPDPAAGPDPTTLPGLALTIADLRLEQADLGQLLLAATPTDAGLDITRLQLQGGQLELEGAGQWLREDSGYRTQLGGSTQIADIGELLVGLGYARQLVDAGGRIEYLLQWPGNPAQVYPPAMTGKITMALDDGRLPELDPGVTRVIGLLNLNALTRRLRLDFSDIYSKGFSFDSIRGDFVFNEGLAETGNLTVQGPSGRIVLDGSADLNQGTLDQHVTVVPNIDATLPIAGTLAGGPVAGVAMLVAQEVLAKEVDNLNRFEYSLSGPWAEPEVVQLETGGALSKLIRPLTAAGPEQKADNVTDTVIDSESPLPPRSTDSRTASPGVSDPVAAETADAGAVKNPVKSLKRSLDSLIDRIRQPDGEPYAPLQADH